MIIIKKALDSGDLAQAFVCLDFPVILLDESARKIITMLGRSLPDTEVTEVGMGQLTQIIKKIGTGDHIYELWSQNDE